MEANRAAPVFAESEIEIAAESVEVWRLMADIDGWPSWNPDVKEATLDGDLRPGNTFRWKAGPGTIISKLEDVDPPSRIAWTGKTFGIKAIHVWRIRDENGRCIVATEESWEGLPPRIFRKSCQKAVEKALRDGPGHLKAAAERGHGPTTSEP